MKSINPACKCIGLLVVTFYLALVHKPMVNLTVFAICLLLLAFSGINRKHFCQAMIPVLLMAAGTFFTGYRFQSGAGMPVSDKSFLLTDSGIYNGLVLSSRVLVFAGLGLLLVLTTDRIQMIQSMNQQLKLPHIFAYGLIAAWGIVPSMFREYRQTRAAFRARGIRVFYVSPKLLKPLLVKSARWAEAISVAMESKGFDGGASRTVYRPVPLGRKDIIFPFVFCGIVAACTLWL